MARRGLHVPTSAGRLTSCFFFSAGPPSCTPTWTFLAAPFSLFMAGPLLVVAPAYLMFHRTSVSPPAQMFAGREARHVLPRTGHLMWCQCSEHSHLVVKVRAAAVVSVPPPS